MTISPAEDIIMIFIIIFFINVNFLAPETRIEQYADDLAFSQIRAHMCDYFRKTNEHRRADCNVIATNPIVWNRSNDLKNVLCGTPTERSSACWVNMFSDRNKRTQLFRSRRN